MSTPAPAPTSRTRQAPEGDEEAATELKLGEFQDVDALTHSEAALVINALVAKRRMDRKNVNETEYVFASVYQRVLRRLDTRVLARFGSFWMGEKRQCREGMKWRGEERAKVQ